MRGKKIGKSFLFLAGEGLLRLKKELWGLRGIGVLLTLGYIVLYEFGAAENKFNFQAYAGLWLIFMFPPRMGKLLYLLPFSQKERIRYAWTYACVYVTYLVAAYLLFGGISVLIARTSYVRWLERFFLHVLPCLVSVGGVAASSLVKQRENRGWFYGTRGWFYSTRGWFYSTRGWYYEEDSVTALKEEYRKDVKKKRKEEMTEEELRERKRRIRENVLLFSGIAVEGFWCFGSGFFEFLPEAAKLLCSGAAYLSAAMVAAIGWKDTVKELRKSGYSGKEGSRCSL